MRKADVDYILGSVLESHDNVSDLNFTVARPPQVEVSGELTPVVVDPGIARLTPFQTETLALHLMQCDRRLSQILISQGSCDCSYALPGKARFRVNIFQQRNSYSIVLRKLSTRIFTIDDLAAPAGLSSDGTGEEWTDLGHRRHRKREVYDPGCPHR